MASSKPDNLNEGIPDHVGLDAVGRAAALARLEPRTVPVAGNIADLMRGEEVIPEDHAGRATSEPGETEAAFDKHLKAAEKQVQTRPAPENKTAPAKDKK